MRRNREAFRRYQLVPRYLIDVSTRDQSTELLGRRYASPFGISPTGLAGLFYPGADELLAQAAKAANLPFLLSSASNASVEAVAKLAPDHVWFQIYGTRDESEEKLANVLVDPIKDRNGRSILTVRDQNTFAEQLRQKRLMTLIHLWMIHRFKADAVYYVTPTEDNVYQTEKMKSHGIFRDVNKDVGEVIVADVNHPRIEELLAPDREALMRLIRKED
jgi:isopentenyl diphosphate isomerase/L-lactate dehydrogenase-like FMN-dependent dehydrogenase